MKTEEDIILFLRERARFHKEHYESYNSAADKLEGESSESNTDKTVPSSKIKTASTLKRTKYSSLTFREGIVRIFDNGIPMTAKQLMAEFSEISGKEIKYGTFSSQLSTLKNENSVIQMEEIRENPLRYRYLYGLTEWFDKNKLKMDYLNRVKMH